MSDHSQMNKFAMKTSDRNNDRILNGEELNHEPSAKLDRMRLYKAEDDLLGLQFPSFDASAAEEGVVWYSKGKRVSSEYQRI